MGKRIKHYLRKYCYIIIPLVLIVCLLTMNGFGVSCFDVIEKKQSEIIAMSTAFIGVLLTIFTLYASVQKDKMVVERLKKSGHHAVFKKIIVAGCLLFTANIFFCLYDSRMLGLLAFASGVAELMLALWYIYQISDFM